MSRLPAPLANRAPQVRQAARVTIASALTYAAYRLLGLPQGYWAVFTVVIVMQGSIATTLGAAADRLAGTIAGALIGGVAAFALHRGDVTTGVALTLVIGIAGLAAAIRPQLKAAPITAAIMILTQPPGIATETFVVHRILEIALGGFIGVACSVLILPARSQPLAVARAGDALAGMQRLLVRLAEALETRQPLVLADEHAALRTAVGAVEQAMSDADRERASGLAYGAAPPAITRALWRVRNDLVLVSRALDHPLPATVADRIAGPAAALLRGEADFAGRCATALRTGTPAEAGEAAALYGAFEAAFGGLRDAGLIRPLDFVDAGHVFGLAFAIEVLHRDLADLGDRFGAPPA